MALFGSRLDPPTSPRQSPGSSTRKAPSGGKPCSRPHGGHASVPSPRGQCAPPSRVSRGSVGALFGSQTNPAARPSSRSGANAPTPRRAESRQTSKSPSPPPTPTSNSRCSRSAGYVSTPRGTGSRPPSKSPSPPATPRSPPRCTGSRPVSCKGTPRVSPPPMSIDAPDLTTPQPSCRRAGSHSPTSQKRVYEMPGIVVGPFAHKRTPSFGKSTSRTPSPSSPCAADAPSFENQLRALCADLLAESCSVRDLPEVWMADAGKLPHTEGVEEQRVQGFGRQDMGNAETEARADAVRGEEHAAAASSRGSVATENTNAAAQAAADVSSASDVPGIADLAAAHIAEAAKMQQTLRQQLDAALAAQERTLLKSRAEFAAARADGEPGARIQSHIEDFETKLNEHLEKGRAALDAESEQLHTWVDDATGALRSASVDIDLGTDSPLPHLTNGCDSASEVRTMEPHPAAEPSDEPVPDATPEPVDPRSIPIPMSLLKGNKCVSSEVPTVESPPRVETTSAHSHLESPPSSVAESRSLSSTLADTPLSCTRSAGPSSSSDGGKDVNEVSEGSSIKAPELSESWSTKAPSLHDSDWDVEFTEADHNADKSPYVEPSHAQERVPVVEIVTTEDDREFTSGVADPFKDGKLGLNEARRSVAPSIREERVEKSFPGPRHVNAVGLASRSRRITNPQAARTDVASHLSGRSSHSAVTVQCESSSQTVPQHRSPAVAEVVSPGVYDTRSFPPHGALGGNLTPRPFLADPPLTPSYPPAPKAVVPVLASPLMVSATAGTPPLPTWHPLRR